MLSCADLVSKPQRKGMRDKAQETMKERSMEREERKRKRGHHGSGIKKTGKER